VTLAVEHRNGRPTLVAIPAPDAEAIPLAIFRDEVAAEIWAQEHNRSMLFAREVGRARQC